MKTRTLIISAAAALAVLGSSFIFFNYGFVEVGLSGSDSAKIHVYRADESTVSQFDLMGGQKRKLFLKKGSYGVRVEGNEKQTVAGVAVSPHTTTSRTVSLLPEKQASRLGGGSMGCGYLLNGVYFSYSCQGDTALFRHTPLTAQLFSDKTAIPDESTQFQAIQPFSNGALRLLINSEGKYTVDAFSGSGTTTSVALPASLQDPVLLANNQEDAPYAFAVLDRDNGSFYLYKSASDNPRTLKPEGVSNIRSASLDGRSLTIFHTDKPRASEGTSNDEGENIKKYVSVFSLDNTKQIKRLPIPDSIQLTRISIAGDAFISESDTSVMLLNEKGGKLAILGIIREANSYSIENDQIAIAGNDNIYTGKAGGFEFHRTFSSRNNLTISNFSLQNGNLTFSAYPSKNQKNALPDAFAVSANNVIYPRAEWFLPYSQNPKISRLDYNNSTLKVLFKLDSLVDNHTTGARTADPNEFNTEKTKLLNQMKADGILGQFKDINFSF